MARNLKPIIFTALILGAGLLCLAPFAPDSWVYYSDHKKSEAFIQGVEAFSARMGRVPTEQEAAQITRSLGWPASEECPCYEPQTEHTYIVWFGTRLGSSLVFNSATKRWNEEG